MKKYFNKSEIIYLILAIIGALLISLIIINDKIRLYISGLNPILQFFLITISIYIIFFLIFKSIALKRKAWSGALGSTLSVLAFDIIMPGYHVTKSGLVVGELFGAGSVDYLIGYLLSLASITGLLAVILTYIVVFPLMLFLIAVLLKNFVKKI